MSVQGPVRATFTTKIIPSLYQDAKSTIKQKFKDNAVYTAATHDCWTSLATESFSTVTAHYIDPEMWELNSLVFETKKMEEQHTAKIIADMTRACLDDWNLEQEPAGCQTESPS